VGIVALDAEGNPLWKYRGAEGGARVSVRCPAATADIDGDGRCEIFAAGQFGPLCLNGDGTLRWETLTGDDFISAVIIADVDGNGEPELYACSKDDNAVWCFDARTGAIRWKTTMVGGADVYPSSSLAVADVDDDGIEEIIVADQLGHVYCLEASGAIRWIFPIEKRTHAAPSVGDVDGDGEVEILVAGGDHYLYCIDARGALEWRYRADLRLMYPATLADVDNDGKTEILFCGSDKTLRCLTLGSRYAPERMPWPSRRFDAAQSGSSFGKRGDPSEAKVIEHSPLFLWGGFEQVKVAAENTESVRKHQPRGWTSETVADGNWELDSETKLAGSSSLKVTPNTGPFRLATELIPLESTMRAVDARVAAKGGAPQARLRWIGLRGVLREDTLEESGREKDDWAWLKADGVRPPRDARWLQMVLDTASGETWWDEAQLDGVFESARTLRALVNQAGFDIGAPKRFTVQSNFVAQQATFALLDNKDAMVFEAPLKHEGRIQGAYGHDWGHEYWRGDFSVFDTPGKYRIRIRLDDMTDVSWPFEIGEDVLWEKTSRPAYRFFYYQRCGMEIPGFHKACHLDDAMSPDGKVQHELWGGWHDAGDYNTYDNIPYLLGLTAAYGTVKEAWDRQDEDGNGVSDFFDEILWGGDHERRMVAPDGSAYGGISSGYGYWGPPELETDNIPGTGDERAVGGNDSGNDSSMHAAALAAIALYTAGDKGPWIETAQRALDRCIAQGQGGPWPFSAAVYLYAATKEQRYADLARKFFPGPNVEAIAAIRLYDSLFHEDHGKEFEELLVKSADAALLLAKNPFGVYTHGPEEKPNFFGTPSAQGGWHVGNSSYVLQAANTVALAHQYKPDPRYFEFVYDQFNWILGNNPYDISLMEAVGSAFPPTYHHRY
ncbi:MAG TPA: glycoside hydrolase family 9 protein, partial [Phycisphaerae bacterium]|nr:glycoside hydrolase family 9 protein [Phycisphaerae bacterium]